MKIRAAVAVACVVLLRAGAAAPMEQSQSPGREPNEVGGQREDAAAWAADPADLAQLSLLSGHNTSGHWLTKVRLLHAAGAAGEGEGEGASLPPVHLQLQRSSYTRTGGARIVALEATLSGSPSTALLDSSGNSSLLESSQTRCPKSKASCPTAQPCPVCPPPQPCSSPCPAPDPCPELPECPSLTPLPCPACPTCPSIPACPTLSSPPRRIPPGYVLKEGFGYYKYHTVPATWFEANATCEREGAHLVIINSLDEAKLVNNLFTELRINNMVHNGIHVGIHDTLEEGVFLTVLGQPIAETGFEEWDLGESNDAAKEDCVILRRNLKYDDTKCEWVGSYACELPN